MRKVIAFFILCCIITACSGYQKELNTNFAKLGVLQNGDTIIADVPCVMVRNLYVMDSILVVCCYESVDKNVFYLYNKSTGKLLRTFGTIGNGPGEMDLSPIYAERGQRELYHNTFNTPKYIKFSIDSFLNNNTNGVTYYKICDKRINAGLHRYKDSLFISDANGWKGYEYRFALINHTGDTTFCFRDSTRKDSFPYLNPSRTHFFTWNNGKLETEIYKITENSIERLHLREYVKEDEYIDEQNYPGITSYVCTTNDYIFCGWSENIKKENRPNDILVFDWTGIAKGLIDIENVEIFNWVVEYDSKENQMYIVIENKQGAQNIVRYDMSHLPL
ncbi:MAG: hypothetical protein IKY70_08050 [Bacteroidales bacterium]|nr:hypothetical protein [Bacteroidales bacterium]